MAEIFAPFEANGPWPLDKRQVFATKAAMKAFDTEHLPDTYFAVCNEDHKLYIYSVDNVEDENTGKWQVFSGGGGGSLESDLTATVGLGGITKGKKYPAGTSLEDIITDLIAPYVKFTFSGITLTESGTTYEYGTKVTVSKVKINYSNGSLPVITAKIGTSSGGSDIYDGNIVSEYTLTTAQEYDGTTGGSIYCTISDGKNDIEQHATVSYGYKVYYAVTNPTVRPSSTDWIAVSTFGENGIVTPSYKKGQLLWIGYEDTNATMIQFQNPLTKTWSEIGTGTKKDTIKHKVKLETGITVNYTVLYSASGMADDGNTVNFRLA